MYRLAAVFCRCALFLLLTSTAPAAPGDYGFLWWAHGWRNTSPEGARIVCVQTNHYGLALDVGKMALPHLGTLHHPSPYAVAVADSNNVVFDLPPADLGLWIEVDGERYTGVRAAQQTDDRQNYPVRLIESGQLVQRIDVEQLVFENEEGKALEVTGRLELIAWPDRVYLILEIAPHHDLKGVRLGMRLTEGDSPRERVKSFDQVTQGSTRQVGLSWGPESAPLDQAAHTRFSVTNRRDGATIPVTWDPFRGWHNVALPEATWSWDDDPRRQDRFTVTITNPAETALTIPVNFAVDGNLSGIIGTTPILLDSKGRPTGIPVQISKNWHRRADDPVRYEGPWFHGFSQIDVGPGDTWTGELVFVYAWWGDRPAVSHAQLSLVGWGTNQRWDQVAIGSWGESITYDPDVNLNRSMIDDVRPLMVNGMQNEGPRQWTVNVGGGDFLVYFDAHGKKQYLSRMRAAYLDPGPNLTRAVYAGTTPDGALDARIEVSTPAADDVNRSFHKFRYDVRKEMPFSRLAFYQLGADNYNDHQFATIARGNETGVLEEWQTEQGGKRYLRTGIPCEGNVPWFSLHDGKRNQHHPKGAWVNRGLVIRSWKARLGGNDIATPTAAVFGTDNGVPSAGLELVPPPGCTTLLPGDFVEAEVELLVVPAEANTYYGPNKAFRAHLEAHINTWKPIHRLATGNALDVTVTQGTLRRAYPAEVVVDPEGEAALLIYGGVGKVPVTFAGLPAPTGFRLEGAGTHADQFVQVAYDGSTRTWSRIYSLNRDNVEAMALRLRKDEGK